MRRILSLMVFCSFAICESFAGDPDVAAKISMAKKELEPRLLKNVPGNIGSGEATAVLAALRQQTGNLVIDRRQTKQEKPIEFRVDGVSFWRALDIYAGIAGCSYTAYDSAGGVALVDGAKRSAHVSYHGITRTAVKRMTVTNDLESGAGTCVVHLDVAWEPRFEPFYLSVGPVKAEYASRGIAKDLKVQAPSRGQLSVAGRSASAIEIHLPPPPRSSPAISSLEGTFKFLGPSKMLTFRFKEIKPDAALEQEEVGVRLLKVKEGPDRWLVEVQIDNPDGNPVFESYQSWLDNNRISLVSVKRTLSPEPNETVLKETNRTAVIQYAFAAPKSGKLADWTLIYRTPGRIVELTVPYRFENVPLP